jgi:SP family xylose:H+ symportor-like MFS transporter
MNVGQNVGNSGADAHVNTSLVIALTFVATLGGLLFGYDTAVISGAVSSIDAYFINPLGWSETARSSLSGWTISSALFGCIIGAFVAGWVSSRIGRRGGMMVAGAMFLLGSLGSAWPEIGFGSVGQMGPSALIPFITYRIVGGIGVGIASMLSPLYIAEISPPAIRGKLVSFNQLAIVGGILLVYFVNWFVASQGDDAWVKSTGWRLMLASEAIPSAIFMILLLFVPDTPRGLVVRGQSAEALAQLRRVMGELDARTILKEIERTLVVKKAPLLTFGLPVILVGVMISVFQQFVGINAVLYYAPLMFQNMGASTDSALLQTVIVGAANVIFTLVAIFTVDTWGRKPLLVTGAIVMAVAMIALGCLFNAQVTGLGLLVSAVLYIAGFALSWGPVAWVMLSEMFPNSIKGQGLALAVAAQWTANLLVSITFKIMAENTTLNNLFHHGFPYWLYGAMSLLAAVFVIRYVPETKGRSLEEIQEVWGHPAGSPAGAVAPSQPQS